MKFGTQDDFYMSVDNVEGEDYTFLAKDVQRNAIFQRSQLPPGYSSLGDSVKGGSSVILGIKSDSRFAKDADYFDIIETFVDEQQNEWNIWLPLCSDAQFVGLGLFLTPLAVKPETLGLKLAIRAFSTIRSSPNRLQAA